MSNYSLRLRRNGLAKVLKSDSKGNRNNSNQTLFEYPPDSVGGNRNGTLIFTQHDQNQLKTREFLNDTIISFFMQFYLDTEVDEETRRRIHVFNSFFFAKIKSIKLKGTEESNYSCASRWLRGIKLFDKDFIVMPVCEREHWILVILCYPYRQSTARSHKIPDDKLREPAVFVLNSWSGFAPSIKKPLSQFMRYQWFKEKGTLRPFSINSAKANGIRLIFPELPQQKNNYNCGVFILNYFFCFLKNPRDAYIRMFRKQSLANWFEENSIDINGSRRKMTDLIRSRTILWKDSRSSGAEIDRNRLESQEIHIDSSMSSSLSSNECIGEERGDQDDSIIVIH